MPSKLTLEQAAWLTLFALIGIICMLRLEQVLEAVSNARVIVMRDDGGRIIDASYRDVTGYATTNHTYGPNPDGVYEDLNASSMPDSP